MIVFPGHAGSFRIGMLSHMYAPPTHAQKHLEV